MKRLKKVGIVFLICCVLLVIWFQWWHLSKSIFPLSKQVNKQNLEFTLGTPLPVRITEAGGVTFNNKFYLAGGIDAYGRTTNKFWEYDAASDKWTRLPDLPAYINHPGVIATNNKIYIVGGFDPIGLRLRWLMFADWKPLNTIHIFDIATKTWMRGPDMPVKRGAGGVAACDTAIWYVGGINEQKEISNEFYCLNLTNNTWQRLPSMPTARDHMRMERVGNKLYAISGRKDDLRKNLGMVEVYDLEKNAWSAVDDIPTPRGGFGSTVAGKYIYTFGGEHFFNCFDVIERLNTETGKWEKLPTLPEARHGIVAGLIHDKIHLVSGGRHPRISTSNIHRILAVKENQAK